MINADVTFTQILEPNTFMYNTMIKCYVSSSKPKRALPYYTEMRKNGLLADNYTDPVVLEACGMMSGLWKGREIHGEVVKGGFGRDVIVTNGLIGMYCRVGEMNFSSFLFDEFTGKDWVSWNLMLDGYVRFGETEKAHKLFNEMPERCSEQTVSPAK